MIPKVDPSVLPVASTKGKRFSLLLVTATFWPAIHRQTARGHVLQHWQHCRTALALPYKSGNMLTSGRSASPPKAGPFGSSARDPFDPLACTSIVSSASCPIFSSSLTHHFRLARSRFPLQFAIFVFYSHDLHRMFRFVLTVVRSPSTRRESVHTDFDHTFNTSLNSPLITSTQSHLVSNCFRPTCSTALLLRSRPCSIDHCINLYFNHGFRFGRFTATHSLPFVKRSRSVKLADRPILSSTS
jgi:hypothetical protein